MSSKKCARCEKTVYPLEELKCLDKIWHKGCFKCQECGMTLNMKTYKGFNKLPYCSAHCPQAKHTTVADTPEAKRLAENTRIQSQVKYHEDFEKLKGKVTQVADDPETMRIRQTSKIISNVAYHGELERKNLMEQRRGLLPQDRNGHGDSAEQETSTTCDIAQFLQTQPVRKVGSIADYDPLNDNYGSSAVGYNPPQAQHYYRGPAPAMQRVMPSQSQVPSGRTFRAMYDYVAQDVDEVSFLDGDMIVSCVPIDEGWMTGTVQRTGLTGMLPANYVEPIN
ncbi:LIM and SH3 domain protein F42H10.3 isoform X3 [Dermacentor andersoni]|uniref:LIM and SH3 domain protein F42H10.3 isoform X3 n=1 Tax=Dermacentor andersoni TaxID=34620 RepID=UPI0021553369|nr:LIM and SH3 domain protein Lasp-like isoform X3 [Dermacentor andersoni]